MSDQTELSIQELKFLVEHLRQMPRVVRLGQAATTGSAEDVATEAATGLLDICQSADLLFKELLPRLMSLPPDGAHAEEVLDEIAEEYRHISYHLANTRLFDYVVPRKS